jgi:Dolichyl-phosphate-mannose-protein mannosyltransferase
MSLALAVSRPAADAPKIRDQRQPGLILAMTGVAFALRLVELRVASIWYDEGLAVWAARQPLLAMARWTAGDVHPPLYFALLHVWRLGSGDSEFAVRYLSVMFGTLGVVVLWKLGGVLIPQEPWVAVGAAGLLAISRFDVWWSQETRMYALGALLCVGNLLFTVYLGRRFEWRWALGWVVCTAAALWTLYILAFVLVVDGLYWLGTLGASPTWRDRWRRLRVWVALDAIVLLSFAPWLVVIARHVKSWSVTAVAIQPGGYLRLYATLLTLGESANVDDYRLPMLVIVGIVLAGVIVLGLGKSRLTNPGGLGLLLLVLTVPPAIIWVITNVPRSLGYVPRIEARYLMPFSPAFSLLTAWAIASLAWAVPRWRWLVGLLLMGVVLVFQVPALLGYYADRALIEDYQSIAQTLQAQRASDDAVVLHTDFGWPVFSYYWTGGFTGVSYRDPISPASVAGLLGPLWSDHAAIWLVVDDDALRADPSRLVEQWLSAHAVDTSTWRFGTKRLVLYARTPERARTLGGLAPGFVPPLPLQPLRSADLAVVGWEQPVWLLRGRGEAHAALYVRRAGAGGDLTIQLGDPAIATTVVTVPSGTGIVRLPISVNLPLQETAGKQPWLGRIGTAQAVLGWEELVGSDGPPPAANRSAGAVTPSIPLDATFGAPPPIRLMGYDVKPGQPGQTLTVILYWNVLASPAVSYKVFVHVLDQTGAVIAQHDDFPNRGARPTTTWQPGETIVDTYEVPIGSTVQPGAYALELGFYDPSTGDRLAPVETTPPGPLSGNRLLIPGAAAVTVLPPASP